MMKSADVIAIGDRLDDTLHDLETLLCLCCRHTWRSVLHSGCPALREYLCPHCGRKGATVVDDETDGVET
jgi:Zn finger protein HypA/HybF involved in hydrogenase expression